jgi:hypothetical protein
VGKAFWLGIIGGIFGILAAVLVVLIGGIGEAFNASGASSLYTNAALAFVFSVVGIAGGALERRKLIGAALMVIGGIGVLIAISLFGVLPFILFLVGGILILAHKKDAASRSLEATNDLGGVAGK